MTAPAWKRRISDQISERRAEIVKNQAAILDVEEGKPWYPGAIVDDLFRDAARAAVDDQILMLLDDAPNPLMLKTICMEHALRQRSTGGEGYIGWMMDAFLADAWRDGIEELGRIHFLRK